MTESFDNLFYLPVSESPPTTEIKLDDDNDLPTEPKLTNEPNANEGSINTLELIEYQPLNYHWFYTSYLLDKLIWLPLSFKDSNKLEQVYTDNKNSIKELRNKNKTSNNNFIVPIKGGRFEVDLVELEKRSVYWDDKKKSEVRRCLWFYKENNELRFQPYDEEYSEFLETEYEKTLKTNAFHRRIDYFKERTLKLDVTEKENTEKFQKQQSIIIEEAFVFHSTLIMLHFTQANMLDEFSNLTSDASRPRIVKRGIDEIVEKVEPDEIDHIDHLCFVIHGIGEGCDLKFRPIVDCVDDFRDISAFIIDSHLKPHIETNKLNGRVEFLPISWHEDLHGDATGVDNRLKPISLPSIPKLRQYSNSTILDVLFYTSPIYCQTIISKVGNEMNRLTKMFLDRNPSFNGNISLIGHSLGSLIVFDLLTHQFNENNEISKMEDLSAKSADCAQKENLEKFLCRLNLSEYKNLFDKEKITTECLSLLSENDLSQIGIPLGPRKIILEEIKKNLIKKDREEIEYKIKTNLNQHLLTNSVQKKSADYCNYGLAGTGQLMIKYPQLDFKVANFFALGSPIGMFLTVRGIEKIENEFKLPTCDGFFNIFHPFDPVAYRLEPLICSSTILRPVLMPHHKGRKRMHIELREGLTKVGVDLKEKMYGQIKSAWTSITELAKLPILGNASTTAAIEAVDCNNVPSIDVEKVVTQISMTETVKIETEKIDDDKKESSESSLNVDLGKLNMGRRIDYVLQERPIESFNEYLFALASHASYWESEDTLLLIIKEIYSQGNTVDANTELHLNDQQQQLASWITHAATSAISSNVQKTFSYFNMSVPLSISSALASGLTTQITNSKTSLNSVKNANIVSQNDASK